MFVTYPVSVPLGTPVTNVGLKTSQGKRLGEKTESAHHGHRLIVISKTSLDLIEEGLCELDQ